MPEHHGPPAEMPIGRALSDATRTLERLFGAALAKEGGSLPMWHVLLALKQRPTRTQVELADAVGVGNPTMTHHLDALERAGYVTRARDADDRRVVRVELTAAGDEQFHRLRKAATAFDERVRAGVSERDLATVRRTLARLVENAVDRD